MLILLIALAASPADTIRYAIEIQGNPAGRQTLVKNGAESRIGFEFNDRGRGPKTETSITVDPKGIPTAIAITGNDYLKQKVDERLTTNGSGRSWSSSAERGTSPDRSAFFLPRETAPEISAMLVRAALGRPGSRIGLLPAGEATVESIATRTITAAGRTKKITLYAVTGLGFVPDYLWLEADGTLFGILAGWQRTIQDGWQATGAELVALQDSIGRERSRALATRLADRPKGPVAFVKATIFDAAAAKLVPNQTVIVEGSKITAVGPTGTVKIPTGARTIDLTGKTLLPGLWDMHAHLSEVDGPLNTAAGVTGVRDMANDVEFLQATRKAFDEGTAIGPRVLMAGFMDGPGPYAGPTKALVSTKEQAFQWIDRYASLGYEQIKLYSSLDPALVPLIAERAHAKGMRLSGHIPRGMIASRAVTAGYDEIQHTNMLFLEFMGDTLDTRTPVRFTAVAKRGADLDLASDSVRKFLSFLKAHHTVVDPTLATFEGMFVSDPNAMNDGDAAIAARLPAEVRRGLVGGGLPADSATRVRYRASYAKMLAMVKALYDNGIPIVAGTDCMAGFCLHRELELYVKAGIPAAQVLKIATLGGPTVMKHADRWGTIAPGKLADLIVVAGNPVERISDIRKVDLVMKGGAIYDPALIDQSLGILPWRSGPAVTTRPGRPGE